MDRDQFDENDLENYVVVYDNIVSDSKFTIPTRFLAAQLRDKPYFTVKDFLSTLTDHDVQHYLDMVEEDRLEEIVLLSQMLSRAEGVIATDLGMVSDHVNRFANFIVLESLYRKRLIDIFRENMSFGVDMDDKPVARKKDD